MKRVSGFRYMSGRMLTGTVCVVAAMVACRSGALAAPAEAQLTETGQKLEVRYAGMRNKTRPVEISLVKGKNALAFSRRGGDNLIRGLTIRDFTLTPVTIRE